MNESLISNLKKDCLHYIRYNEMSAELAERIQILKDQIPNLSNHEAIELILDYVDEVGSEKTDGLSLWKVLKGAVSRRFN